MKGNIVNIQKNEEKAKDLDRSNLKSCEPQSQGGVQGRPNQLISQNSVSKELKVVDLETGLPLTQLNINQTHTNEPLAIPKSLLKLLLIRIEFSKLWICLLFSPHLLNRRPRIA